MSVGYSSTSVQVIYDLIASGDLAKARHQMESVPTTSDNAEIHYLRGILAPDAATTCSEIEKALESTDDPGLICNSVIALANYSLFNDDYQTGLSLIDRYEKSCRRSERYPELINLRARLRLQSGEGSKSLKELKDNLKSSTNPRTTANIVLSVGDILSQKRKFKDAGIYYRKLIQSVNREYVALALSRLADNYRADKKAAEAQTASEAFAALYSKSIVVAEHIKYPKPAVTRASDPCSDTVHLVQVADYFAVRVGAYKSRTDANRLYQSFRQGGYTAQITTEGRSGKKYFMVDVGRFRCRTAADRFLTKLNYLNKKSFAVVSLK